MRAVTFPKTHSDWAQSPYDGSNLLSLFFAEARWGEKQLWTWSQKTWISISGGPILQFISCVTTTKSPILNFKSLTYKMGLILPPSQGSGN